MEFHLIQTEAEFDRMAEAWNGLLDESATHVPFLRHEYLRIWWQNRGGGEWQDGELAIITATEGERLVGIAPFFLTSNSSGEPALLLLGSVEISDFLDVIARESDLEAFIGGLLDYLPGAGLPEWRLLDLYNVLDSSPTLPALERVARSRGWGYEAEQLQHSPYIPLPGDWETYLAKLDKKQRHEIRRKLRRFEDSAPQAHWTITDDPSTIQADGQAFLDLMAHDDAKARFLTSAMRKEMMETIDCAFEYGCLQLAFLEIGGEKAAGYLSFDFLGRIWVYNSGLDGRFTEYSPGWVLLAYLIRWANEHGRSEFDFMRGNEEYKYRFGAVDRFVMHARVTKP